MTDVDKMKPTVAPGTVRVGFLGASDIAHKVWGAIDAAGSMQVTVVGARDPAKAEQLIKECAESLDLAEDHRPIAATYDELVTSPNVDVIYVSIPVSKRHEWVLKCVENGKHVVGEKPPAMNGAQLRTWLEALAAKQLLYMDGTMFSHGPYVESVVKAVPRVGHVRRLTCNLTYNGSEDFLQNDIRCDPAMEPLGCLGDVGWYCVRSFLHVMNFAIPTAVVGRVLQRNAKGAVLAFSGELTFTAPHDANDIVTAQFHCSFVSASELAFVVSGTEGTIVAPEILFPFTDRPNAFTIVKASMSAENTELRVTRTVETVPVSQENGRLQETQMWRDVRDALRADGADGSGRLVVDETEAQKWGKRAWITQCVLDTLFESAGGRLPEAPPA